MLSEEKLPGVDVGKDGQIKYNGKAIRRFTVEGLDLSKGQYNKLTENIRAKDVKKAQVVEHDQPIKAMRNRVFTDDIGMNIVLKDSARDQFFVMLRPYFLTDAPTHVGGDAVGKQIGKKRQMEYSAQYDRSGRDLNNQFSLFYNAFYFASTAELPRWYSSPTLQAPIDGERLRMISLHKEVVKTENRRQAPFDKRLPPSLFIYLHSANQLPLLS